MAYPSRSIADISARVRSAFRRELPGTDASAAQNVLYVFSKVLALLLKEVDLRLGWLYDQLFASTADDEHLERRHAYEFGVVRRPASSAAGNLIGSAHYGTTYPIGVKFLSGGVEYVSTETIASDPFGVATFNVKALSTGASTNRLQGDQLQLAEPGLYPGLGPVMLVGLGGLSGGADIEDTESLRARVLERKKKPPQGGAESDYERWTKELSFVSRAWARRLDGGPGALGIWFLGVDGAAPSSPEIAAVKASLEARRLIGVRDLQVQGPTLVAVNITVRLSPDTVNTRFNVASRLADLFATRVRPGLPSDSFVLPRAWISEAISTAIGEDSHTLTLPAGDLTYTTGQMPVLGSVTYA